MAYTPELSQIGSATLRRLAWFRGKPMSKTLEALLEATGKTMAEIRPGDYAIVLNEDGMPKLRINHYYRQILSDKNKLENRTREYIRNRLKSAEWLIKSIHQRQRTIYRVTESIVRFQRDFLDRGIIRLKPLVLRDVAEEIRMHESTVSRATTNKYVHIHQGIFELKYFFSAAIKKTDGDAVASESVKEHTRNINKSEDVTKPYGDQAIMGILKKMNMKIHDNPYFLMICVR